MFRSILVSLDGSTFGEHALPTALGIARKAGAQLEVVHVHVPSMETVDPGEWSYLVDPDSPERAQERGYLGEWVKRLREQVADNIQVSAKLLTGSVSTTLQEEAVDFHADLIVMATHGKGPLARFWKGSVTDQLAHRCNVPMLLVRADEQAATLDLSQDPDYRHILIPLDGSPLAETVIEPTVTLGSLTQAEYTLLRVHQPTQERNSDSPAETAGDGAETAHPSTTDLITYLNGVAEPLRAQGLTVHTRIAHAQHIAQTIVDEAEKLSIDLIAMASHCTTGVVRWFLGSVADQVIHHAHTPILLYHPPRVDQPGQE